MKSKNKSNKWNITKEFIIREYIQKKRSLPEIAKEIGMPYETLFWYKKKFGIYSYTPSFWIKLRGFPNAHKFPKSHKPWNKGKKGLQISWNKGKQLSEEYKRKVSIATKRAMAKQEIKSKVQKTQFKKGITPWNKDKSGVYSTETIDKIREARLNQIFPKKDTNIEIILFNILSNLNIKFERHKAIKRICQADAFIKPNIVLFADGDFWHCNPRFYKEPKSIVQIKNLERDKKADSNLIKEGYIVKRFWEHNLINNKEDIIKTIKNLVKGD